MLKFRSVIKFGGWKRTTDFDLEIVRDVTTTLLYGQMDDQFLGKTSIAGCSMLSPEDTYNELTGLKIAFKNMAFKQFSELEARAIYSQFRKYLYLMPEGLLEV